MDATHISSLIQVYISFDEMKRALVRSVDAGVILVVDHDQEGQDHGSLVLYCTARN